MSKLPFCNIGNSKGSIKKKTHYVLLFRYDKISQHFMNIVKELMYLDATLLETELLLLLFFLRFFIVFLL